MNPLTTARREQHLTQAELALYAQVSRLTVVRAEQGLYIQPPTAILKALDLPLVPTTLAYRHWVRLERQRNSACFPGNVGELTFERYMKLVSSSFMGFCRKIVLPQNIVQAYLDRGACEETINEALSECGTGLVCQDFLDYKGDADDLRIG